MAKQARRILNLLDDTPIVPGDAHPPFQNTEYAREILNDAEDELRNWQPNIEPIHSSAGTLGVGAMPGVEGTELGQEGDHPAYREKTSRSRSRSAERRAASIGSLGSREGGEVQPLYTEAEAREVAQAGVI